MTDEAKLYIAWFEYKYSKIIYSSAMAPMDRLKNRQIFIMNLLQMYLGLECCGFQRCIRVDVCSLQLIICWENLDEILNNEIIGNLRTSACKCCIILVRTIGAGRLLQGDGTFVGS